MNKEVKNNKLNQMGGYPPTTKVAGFPASSIMNKKNMEKVLLNSDQEYFQYCIDREVGDVSDRLTFIEDGEKLKIPHVGQTSAGETILIDTKPTHYPCMLLWYIERVGYEKCNGTFIYHDDF